MFRTGSDADWRTKHCAESPVEVVNRLQARDVWAELGGCPRSWREAANLYRRLGVRNLRDAVTAVLGPPISIRQAKRNDVVMVRGALGICAGEVAVCLGATVPLREAECAWPVRGIGDE